MIRRRLDALERLFDNESAAREEPTILTEEERITALTRLYSQFPQQIGYTGEDTPEAIWQWSRELAVRRMAMA